jgi:hypothetical protein
MSSWSFMHRLNMELDLQSLFWLLCTAVLIGREPASLPLPPYLGSYTRALLVSKIDDISLYSITSRFYVTIDGMSVLF